MKLYLDNSVLNRPFDDQSGANIRLETIATVFILHLIEKKRANIVNSEAIEYENKQNPFFERKKQIFFILSLAHDYQEVNNKIKQRAKELEELKITGIDSLHLACAEKAKVDYFITCDYDIIRRYKGQIKVINPVDFIKIYSE